MADKKISQLTGAATPLAGTEVLPIVQSGSTVKVSAADVTAGRSVSAANLVVTSATVPANGVYLPSANSVGIATNSSGKLIVDANGNLGVGSAAPSARVDASLASLVTGLAGVVANPQLAVTNSQDYGWPTGMLFRAPLVTGGAIANNAAIWAQWTSDNNAYLGFATNGGGTLTERARIDSSGNLLVGTTTAAYSAADRGNVTVNGASSAIYAFSIAGAQSGYLFADTNGVEVGAPAAKTIRFNIAGERATIDSSGNITASTGNFVVGTAGRGIDFSANGGDVLNQYDEGSWTPTITASSGTITSYTSSARYTRVGRMVTANINFKITNAGTASGAIIASLSLAADGAVTYMGSGRDDNTGNMVQGRIQTGLPSQVWFATFNNASIAATNTEVFFTVQYFV